MTATASPVRDLREERVATAMMTLCDLLDHAESTPEAEHAPLRERAVVTLTGMLGLRLTPRMRAQVDRALNNLSENNEPADPRSA